MAILVTRPVPDGEKTAAALRARGHEALLSPMLRFEPVAFEDDDEIAFDGVILSSANAVRAVAQHPIRSRLMPLPVFAVGEHTARVALDAGFARITVADGDAVSLRDRIVDRAAAGKLKKKAALCYLAGENLTRDLAGELGARGFTVVTHTAYRMVPIAGFSEAIGNAFRMGVIEAVMHYSRRSARAYLDAARNDGVEISALALPQCCISEAVATVLREAGAMQVAAARAPDEKALLDVVDRMVKASSS
ncbi:MAG: uroporphyrinogen III synthase [Afipia sp. 62-7]|nr:uroporphyrinogen-III synthase [Afipia sp.]OJU16121.1 MAG: uroporphyrinogen III synthase [Afipia sp. 62-7]